MIINSVGTDLTEEYWTKRLENSSATSSVSAASAVTQTDTDQTSEAAAATSSNFDSFIASSEGTSSTGIYSISTDANGNISVVTDSVSDDDDTELTTKQAQLKQLETQLLTCDEDEKEEIEQEITNLEKEISDLEDDDEE